MDKREAKQALRAQSLAGAVWTKSELSGGTGQDCLEVTKVAGGWVLRDSFSPEDRIWLTDSEYEAFCGGVRAGQPGLVPGV
ncbi:DUF397 domain-containing protein [Streptomyces sp. NPDC046887]|uniref:DUF397 domain-containing protein n=1 Tax=Streptomyces sp. NPDC046887 TaxID=3155472 RepID=UPI0033DBF3CD